MNFIFLKNHTHKKKTTTNKQAKQNPKQNKTNIKKHLKNPTTFSIPGQFYRQSKIYILATQSV